MQKCYWKNILLVLSKVRSHNDRANNVSEQKQFSKRLVRLNYKGITANNANQGMGLDLEKDGKYFVVNEFCIPQMKIHEQAIK